MPVPADVIVGWPSAASIISGWARETALDARFVKQVLDATTNPGSNGGAATHAHPFPTHSHTGGTHSAHTGGTSNASDLNTNDSWTGNATFPLAGPAHTHTFTIASGSTAATASDTGGVTNYDTTTSEPPFFTVIFIKSDGTPLGIPHGAVVFFNSATLPTNWRACDGSGGAPDMRNRFWKGAAAGGNGGSTGGTSDAHVHTSASHAHASGGTHTHTQSNAAGTVNNGGSNFSSNINSVLFTHDHPDGTTGTAAPAPGGTVASSVASADGQPAWQKLHAIQNNTGVASYPKRIIALWLGTVANIPTGWVLCGGTNGAPNVLDKFVKTASTAGEIETTGGAATHTHGNGSGHTHSFASHTHTFTALANPGGQQDAFHNAETQAHRQHGHTVTGSSGADSATSGSTAIGAVANTTNRPAYTDVAYIQLISQPPDVPTINIPVASASYASILGLDVTVSDPDLDNVFAVLEYDQSDGNWAVIGNGTTVASGQPSTLDWDISSTAPGLAYRVRARAIDSDGFSSAYALTDTFIIGLGFVKLHAASNTAFFFAVNNTRSFWAEPQTAKYILAKGYPTELVQHDRRPFFGVQILSELTNAAVNLTGCTVTFGFCHQFAKVPAVVDGACIITDKAHGRAEYRWATGDLAVPGIYTADVTVTHADGKSQSIAVNSIEVKAALGN